MTKYSRCVLAGGAASVLSGIVYIVTSSLTAFSMYSDGSFEEITTAFTAGPLLITILLAGFAIGFFWMLKRTAGPRLTS